MKKSISVIIPCYNMEQYIERCYNSLATQTDASDIEIIFVNDGSTDNTLEYLHKYQTIDKRVIVVDQENAGVSAARNAALDIMSGDYFFLLDSDDYLADNSISAIKKIICEYDPDIIMPAYNNSINGKESLVELPIEEGIYDKNTFFKIVRHFPTIPQLVYRNMSQNHRVRFDPSVRCGEVYTYTVSFLRYAQSIYVLKEACYNYFQRQDSATHKPNYANDLTVIDALESIYCHGSELCHHGSFIVTAFKIAMSFTYNKYLRFPYNTDAIRAIERLLSAPVIKKNIKEVLFGFHMSIKDRCLACYIYMMPTRLGFRLLNKCFSKS